MLEALQVRSEFLGRDAQIFPAGGGNGRSVAKLSRTLSLRPGIGPTHDLTLDPPL